MGVSQVALQLKGGARITWAESLSANDGPNAVEKKSLVFSKESPPPSTAAASSAVASAAAVFGAVASIGAVASDDVGSQPTKKPRVLGRTRSDPNVVTKEILHNMQTAAQAGAFFSKDPSDNKTVELRARWALRGTNARRPPWRFRWILRRRRGEARYSYAVRQFLAS